MQDNDDDRVWNSETARAKLNTPPKDEARPNIDYLWDETPERKREWRERDRAWRSRQEEVLNGIDDVRPYIEKVWRVPVTDEDVAWITEGLPKDEPFDWINLDWLMVFRFVTGSHFVKRGVGKMLFGDWTDIDMVPVYVPETNEVVSAILPDWLVDEIEAEKAERREAWLEGFDSVEAAALPETKTQWLARMVRKGGRSDLEADDWVGDEVPDAREAADQELQELRQLLPETID